MLVFENLECGLYHVKTLKKRVENTAIWFSKMSSMCGIRQVESQARACYVTQFTYKS